MENPDVINKQFTAALDPTVSRNAATRGNSKNVMTRFWEALPRSLFRGRIPDEIVSFAANIEAQYEERYGHLLALGSSSTAADVIRAENLEELLVDLSPNPMRKYTPERASAHQSRIVPIADRLAEFMFRNNWTQRHMVKVATWTHDNEEDHGVSEVAYIRWFGMESAKDRRALTIAKPNKLALLYKDITLEYFPNESLKSLSTHTPETFSKKLIELALENPKKHDEFVFRLEERDKYNGIKTYSIRPFIVRVPDNSDVPESDRRAIIHGSVRVTPEDVPEGKREGTVRLWSIAKIKRKIAERKGYHIALMNRLDRLEWENERQKDPELRSPDFRGLADACEEEFSSKIIALNRAVERSLQTSQSLGPAPQPI